MDSRTFLSVVVPAFDEVERIGATVTKLVAFLSTQPYSSELVVVLDGGRPGATAAIAAAVGARDDVRVLDNIVNRGKGYSVRRGMMAARGDYVVFLDADLSLPIEGVSAFLEALRDGADVAIGSRTLAESQISGDRQHLRRSMGSLFNWLVQRLLLPGFADTQCGFKAFRREAARRIFAVQRIDRFAFDVEVLWLARRFGLRIVEVPVVCEYSSASSVRRFRDGVSILRDLLRIREQARRGAYDLD